MKRSRQISPPDATVQRVADAARRAGIGINLRLLPTLVASKQQLICPRTTTRIAAADWRTGISLPVNVAGDRADNRKHSGMQSVVGHWLMGLGAGVASDAPERTILRIHWELDWASDRLLALDHRSHHDAANVAK